MQPSCCDFAFVDEHRGKQSNATMRLHCVLLLVIFLLWENVESAVVDSDQTNFAAPNLRVVHVHRALTADKNVDISKRMFRSYDAADVDKTDSEERTKIHGCQRPRRNWRTS